MKQLKRGSLHIFVFSVLRIYVSSFETIVAFL